MPETNTSAVTQRHHAPQAPGPGNDFALRNTRKMLRDPLGFFSEAIRLYGDVVRCPLVIGATYIINHPDGVRRVLQENAQAYNKDSFDYVALKRFVGPTVITTDGDIWLRQRRLVQPAFHKQRIAAFALVMRDAIGEMLERWDRLSAATGQTTLDVTDEMGRITLTIVGRSLFGLDLSDTASTVAQGIHSMTAYAVDAFYHPLLPLLGPLSAKNRTFGRQQHMLDDAIYAMIRERRAGKQPEQADMLAMLMEVRDDQGKGLSDQELRSQTLALIAAGNETSAAGLLWMWYLLAQHPAVEARLQEELASVLGGGVPEPEDIARLTYAGWIVSESMRLYPPAWFFGRKAQQDDEIGGYRIPKGAEIWLCPYTTQRHPAFWPEPEVFDPERFSAERSAGRPKTAYFPFGAGNHICLGNAFATTEISLILAMVAQRYRLRLAPNQSVEPEALIALRPKANLRMIAERR